MRRSPSPLPRLSRACRAIAVTCACFGVTIAADRDAVPEKIPDTVPDAVHSGDAAPRGELSLAIDPMPKRYRLACPDRDGGIQRISGEWDGYVDATLRWRPTLGHPSLIIGLAVRASRARDGDLRAYEAGLGFDVGMRMPDPRPSLPVRFAIVGHYSGGALAIMGYANGVAVQRGMDTSRFSAEIEMISGGHRGPQVGMALGYAYELISDVYPRIHVAGRQQGPVVAASLGWRW